MRIAVLRRPEGLVEVSIERRDPFRPPAAQAPLDQLGIYDERVTPLAGDRALAAAWAMLGAVRAPSAPVLGAIERVLASTAPDPLAFASQPPAPRLEEPASAPRRTAAHPRGYRGTKLRPPKVSRPRAIDLRAFLDGGAREAAVLARFGAPTRPVRGPDLFVRTFAWSLRAADRETVAAVRAAFWSLDLEHDEALRRMVAVLVARAPDATTAAWLRALADIAPHRRHAVAELLIEQPIDVAPPSDALARADALSPDDTFRHRVSFLLGAIARGATRYALDGLELSNAYQPVCTFHGRGRGDGALAGVRAAMTTVEVRDPRQARFAMELWAACGELDGLAPLLARAPWASVDRATGLGVARVLADLRWGESAAAKWEALRGHVPAMFRTLGTIAEPYRAKAVDLLAQVSWWHDEPAAVDRALPRALALATRWCAPPAPTAPAGNAALARVLAIDDGAWRALESAPDAWFARLAAACRRKHEASLIECGLDTLARHAPALVGRGFASAPGALLGAARTLGSLRHRPREVLARSVLASPIFRARPAELEPRALVALVDRARPGATQVSRALRTHLRGEAPLRPAQLERARRRIVDAWDEILLGAIEVAVEARVAAGLGAPPSPSPKERHALLFLSSAEEHRRALRRLLKAYFRGDHAYLASHPANTRWLRAHPRLDAALWTTGIAQHVELAGIGEVTLALEHDPLEVLRLGTYVGSCLSLGGGQAYSAVAIVLDVNKQVVYARDRAGAVVARQVLAVSDDDHLCCFTIYPQSAPRELRAAILAYDRAFARALGVPIAEPARADDEDFTIAALVSRGWWFDSLTDVSPRARAPRTRASSGRGRRGPRTRARACRPR